MADVSTLGLRVDASGVVRGTAEAKAALTGLQTTGQRTSQQVENVGRSMTLSAASANRLTAALSPLATTVTGLHPQVGRLAVVIGMLGLSAPIMAGALLGLTALTAAYRKLTDDTRKAREEQEKLTDALNKQAQARVSKSIPGQRDDLEETRALLNQALVDRRRAQLRAQAGMGSAASEEEQVRLLTVRYNEQLKAVREAIQASQTIEGVSTRTADAIQKEAQSVAELNAQLMVLRIQLDAIKRGMPTAGEITMGTMGGVGSPAINPRWAAGRPGYRQDGSPIMAPGMVTRPGRDPGAGTNWGAWAQGAQIAGGLILGTGLAGNGYGAAALSGGLSMAAQGAMLGSVVPGLGTAAGAIVGGVAGMVKSLFDHGKKAREAAAQLKEAQRAFDLSIQARMAAAGGDAARAEDLRRQAQNERELSEARKAGMSKTSIAALRAVQAEEALAIARQREIDAAEKAAEAARELAEAQERIARATRGLREDITVRALRAGGRNDLADTYGMRFAQAAERERAVSDKVSPDTLAMLDGLHEIERASLELNQWFARETEAVERVAAEQTAALERQERIAAEHLRVAEDQLRAQERTVEDLRRALDAVSEYGNSMVFGPLSAMSPYSQLTSARDQFSAIRALALAGDVTAAQSLPGASRSLLEASRGFNASGPAFAADFKLVQDTIEETKKRLGAQLTIEEKILAELQTQTQKLAQQVNELQAQQKAIRDKADDQIAALREEFNTKQNMIWKMVEVLLPDVRTHTKNTALGVGDRYAQALANNDTFLNVVVPDMNKRFNDAMKAKDELYDAERAKLIDTINDLVNGRSSGRNQGNAGLPGNPYIPGGEAVADGIDLTNFKLDEVTAAIGRLADEMRLAMERVAT